ncbi:autophagy protein, partial [Tulasnella sp. 427]
MSDKGNSNMLFANFNQDFTCISVGTKKGYSITNCDPFGRVYTKNDGARGIVEMLFCTSLIALVGAADQPSSSPRKLQIVNTKRQSMICELLFPSSILAVKLNRKTLVVVLEVEIYIYDISNMKLLHVIETTKNPDAIVALSPSSDPSYLAYPSPIPSPNSPLATSQPSSSAAPAQSCDALIFDTKTLSVVNVVQAHKTPIALLSINSTGTMLATCSTKGTVIRVFSLPGAEKLYQFRRGMQGARIHSITFNTVSTLLAVSSATDTVHIFKLSGKGSNGSSSASRNGQASPSAASIDSQMGSGAMEGGYEAFIDGKKKSGVSQSLKRRSMNMARSMAGGMGGFLPNPLAE